MTNEPVREGETVVEGIQNTEGSTLMTLADMSVITAEVKVDETDIVNVQLGQPAEVTVDALPNKVFKGHVTLVGDQALLRSTGVATSQSTTGTEEAKDFKVVVTLDDPSNELRPGLSCTAKITTAHKTNVLSLPIQALTMHDPATDTRKEQGRRPGGVGCSAPSAKPNPVQGVFVVAKGPPRQAARQVRSRHHRHHRRHRYRGALRPERRARRSSPAPTRRCATSRAARCSSATRPSRFRFHERELVMTAAVRIAQQTDAARIASKHAERTGKHRITSWNEDELRMALNGIGIEELAQTAVVPSDDVIVVEDLWRTYDMGSEQQVQALRGVSLASATTNTSPSWAPPARASRR